MGSGNSQSVQVLASPNCRSYTLTLTIPNLCVTGICSVTVVNGLPVVTLPSVGPLCIDAASVQLTEHLQAVLTAVQE